MAIVISLNNNRSDLYFIIFTVVIDIIGLSLRYSSCYVFKASSALLAHYPVIFKSSKIQFLNFKQNTKKYSKSLASSMLGVNHVVIILFRLVITKEN